MFVVWNEVSNSQSKQVVFSHLLQENLDSMAFALRNKVKKHCVSVWAGRVIVVQIWKKHAKHVSPSGACSFLWESVDIEAQILCLSEGDQTHLDVFLFPDQYLLVFLVSAQLIIYLNHILSLDMDMLPVQRKSFALLSFFKKVVLYTTLVAIMEVKF